MKKVRRDLRLILDRNWRKIVFISPKGKIDFRKNQILIKVFLEGFRSQKPNVEVLSAVTAQENFKMEVECPREFKGQDLVRVEIQSQEDVSLDYIEVEAIND